MTTMIRHPEIVTSNHDSMEGMAHDITLRLADALGWAELGTRLFAGGAPPTPKGRKSYGARARRLAALLDRLSGRLMADDLGRRDVAAIMGAKVANVTDADLVRHRESSEWLSWLLDDLEEIGQDIAAPGLAFGPIPDDGSYAWWWAPADDDIIITDDGEAWWGRDRIEGGPAAIPSEMDRLQFWPMVWREDHYGDVEPVDLVELGAGDRTYLLGDYVTDGRGVALYVTRLPWGRAPTTYGAVMVGDDLEEDYEASDLRPITPDEFCSGCGQIGCHPYG